MLMDEVLRALQTIAPLELAEDWDNVGLLAGWHGSQVLGVMTTLDVTEQILQEAIDGKADLIVTHHPMPFHSMKRITNADQTGKIVCKALQHGVSIYSPHTAWDNARGGINDQLAKMIGLNETLPLSLSTRVIETGLGSGRYGVLNQPMLCAELMAKLQHQFPSANLRLIGNAQESIQKIGICCGSGGSLIPKALAMDAQLFLTGEATYHQCLEASARGMRVLMIGHYTSEAFAMLEFAKMLSAHIGEAIPVWASTSKTVDC